MFFLFAYVNNEFLSVQKMLRNVFFIEDAHPFFGTTNGSSILACKPRMRGGGRPQQFPALLPLGGRGRGAGGGYSTTSFWVLEPWGVVRVRK